MKQTQTKHSHNLPINHPSPPHHSDKTKGHSKRREWLGVGIFLLIALPLLLIGLLYTSYWLIYKDNMLLGVTVNGNIVSGQTPSQIKANLHQQVENYIQQTKMIRVNSEDTSWDIPLPPPEAWAIDRTVDEAYSYGREGSVQNQILQQWQALRYGKDWQVPVNVDEMWLESQIATIAAEVDIPLIPPTVRVNAQKQVEVDRGTSGKTVDREQLRTSLYDRLTQLDPTPLTLTVVPTEVNLTEVDVQKATARGEAILKKNLTLTTGEAIGARTWVLSGNDLLGWINVAGGWRDEAMQTKLATIAGEVNRPPQNAKFQFNETTQRVTEFIPALEGLELNSTATSKEVLNGLDKMEQTNEPVKVTLVMHKTAPEIALNSVNNLGLLTLLGRGESTYKGSIPSRVHNVRLASERINGTLVKPGEEFSFNQAVGEVSGATGFKQAYIIKDGRTQLGDGGGVCQVSTTVFRAALNAGLPISERRAHAYRVGYYEQDVKAGIDATVYAPSTDFKFINDTPAHILVQTQVDEPNRHLIFSIYGTSDGRTATISNHTVCCSVAPPPDIFQDDPTLPTGTVKEVDHRVAGAKAKFDYVVTRNGQTIFEKTFYSNYKPWAAVFLRGTGPQ